MVPQECREISPLNHDHDQAFHEFKRQFRKELLTKHEGIINAKEKDRNSRKNIGKMINYTKVTR